MCTKASSRLSHWILQIAGEKGRAGRDSSCSVDRPDEMSVSDMNLQKKLRQAAVNGGQNLHSFVHFHPRELFFFFFFYYYCILSLGDENGTKTH